MFSATITFRKLLLIEFSGFQVILGNSTNTYKSDKILIKGIKEEPAKM